MPDSGVGSRKSALPAAEARAWRDLIRRHLDANGKKIQSSRRQESEADLSQLLSRANRVSDDYHITLAELYNKSVWLIVTGLLFIAAVIVATPDAVPLLGMGAIGGLASRILRISSASALPTDYGALWAPLFLSPVLGALLGWTGILVLQLGRDIDVISLKAIDFGDEGSPSVLALALLFGFTERFFNGVATLVADKVLGGPGTPAQPQVDPRQPTPERPEPAPEANTGKPDDAGAKATPNGGETAEGEAGVVPLPVPTTEPAPTTPLTQVAAPTEAGPPTEVAPPTEVPPPSEVAPVERTGTDGSKKRARRPRSTRRRKIEAAAPDIGTSTDTAAPVDEVPDASRPEASSSP